ncbi:MAG TPA: VOC family protein [Thermodesulfobacteriota bacterium]
MPIRLQAIDHFGLEVADLARAERFYTEVFGLPVKRRMPGVVVLDFNGRSFNLLERRDRAPGDPAAIERPTGRSHLAFTVSPDDFAEAAGRLASAGVPTHPVIDWGDHDGLYFLDPDGNLLELIDRRPAGGRPSRGAGAGERASG